jgi:hypothetical protein
MRALLLIGLPAAWIASATLFVPRFESPAEQQSTAARTFLATLSDTQRSQATSAFDGPQRQDWHFIPRERAGLALGALSDAQRRAARQLIASGLSNQGVLALEGILQLEQVLLDLDRAKGVANSIRDPGLYQLLVCGEPGSATWSWRIEGHHVSIHFTHVDGVTCTTPLFLGTNPAEVRAGPLTGLRVLGAKEDLARGLATSLDAEQRKLGVRRDAPPADVLYAPGVEFPAEARRGIAGAALNAAQRAQLLALVSEHARDLRGALAEREIERARASLDALHYVWIGELELGRACYYAIEAPSWVIEYDNAIGGANHAHCVWRDRERDFGRDPLREHLRAEHLRAEHAAGK